MVRIDEALYIAERNGRKITKRELAEQLWPETKEMSRRVNVANLSSAKRVDVEIIRKVCDITGVSADYLLGLTDNPERL